MCQEISLELEMNERNVNCNSNFRLERKSGTFFPELQRRISLISIMLKQNISIDLMFSIPFLAESGYNIIRIGEFVRKPKQAKLLLTLDQVLKCKVSLVEYREIEMNLQLKKYEEGIEEPIDLNANLLISNPYGQSFFAKQ